MKEVGKVALQEIHSNKILNECDHEDAKVVDLPVSVAKMEEWPIKRQSGVWYEPQSQLKFTVEEMTRRKYWQEPPRPAKRIYNDGSDKKIVEHGKK